MLRSRKSSAEDLKKREIEGKNIAVGKTLRAVKRAGVFAGRRQRKAGKRPDFGSQGKRHHWRAGKSSKILLISGEKRVSMRCTKDLMTGGIGDKNDKHFAKGDDGMILEKNWGLILLLECGALRDGRRGRVRGQRKAERMGERT